MGLAEEIANIKGIIVIPPLNIRGYNEIAHTKASDALAAGRVIVASDLSSIREIVPAENYFFQAGSASDLAKKIQEITNTKVEQLNAIVKVNKEAAQLLTYDCMADNLLSALRY